MCRLAIIDPANGRQPMTSPDGRFHLVFNGAIYNHRELRSGLSSAGWEFRTQCDTEVLLAILATKGVGGLRLLRGMFAFLLWDAAEQRLLAARDPLGIKPLYYTRLPGHGLLFASELNSMFASGQVNREIDPAGVGEYLAWFSVPAPRTIYTGISNLPPGHCLEVMADGRVKTGAWWQLPLRSNGHRPARSYPEFVAELRAQLEDSVKAHQVADVPVGAFLSGGLDSGAIVGLMAATGARRLKTFSLVFDEPGYSEEAGAAATARKIGADHHVEKITGARVAADLPKIIAALDQPTGDGINTYYASRAARAGGVTVALSGLGGDELFGGYPSFRDLPRLARVIPVWRQLPRRLQGALLERLRSRSTVRAQKLADFLSFGRDFHELAALQRRVLPEPARLSLLAPGARALAQRLGPRHPQLDDFAFELAEADPFQIVSAWELRTYMADVLLRDSDVFSMAHSIELRVPLVDRPLLEWLWHQPPEFKYHPRRQKQALRDAIGSILPAEVLAQPKRGFTLPFGLWMNRELRGFLEETFSAASLAACPWLDAAAARSLWADFSAGTDHRAWSRVWTIAVLISFANRPPAP